MEGKEAKIEDYLDLMKELELNSNSTYEWKAYAWCDENGRCEFLENFWKEMQKQAKEYGK